VALSDEPESLDPATATSPAVLQALWLAHTPPATYAWAEGAAGTKLVPGLAGELPERSEDARSYSFTLRPGLRYSDGQRVRAGDFERAIKRALRLHPRGLELFGNVQGARRYARSFIAGADIGGITADERTGEVRVELVAPDRSFAYALAAPMAAPVPPGTPMRDLGSRPPPGVGPYRIVTPRGGAAFLLSRRRGFRLPEVPEGNVDEIAGEVLEDRGGRSRAAIDGFVDVVQGEPPVEMLPQVRSEYQDRYEEHLTLALDYVEMDVTRPPFADVDLRRAVSFALDESELERLRDGFLEPACNVLPPQVSGYRALDPCPYGEREDDSDLVRARQLVEGAGERPPRVLVRAGRDPRGRALERYLVGTLRDLGMRARPARTARERSTAQIAFARRRPALPLPGRYLEVVEDRVLEGRIRLLELDEDPADATAEWADLDREAVEGAELAPYGVETVGVLLSERIDAENCSRFHPVFGIDWSSLCLR